MANPLRQRRREASGFSLIELLVVVGIIMIGAAIALPGIAQYIRNYEIRGATQQVAAAVQQARLSAISKNVNLGVTFAILSPTQYRVVIEDDQRPRQGGTALVPPTWLTVAGEDWSDVISIPGQAGPILTLPNGIQFDNPANCPQPPGAANDWGIRFSRLGSACGVLSRLTVCPDGAPGSNAPSPTNYIRNDTATGTGTVCVFQSRTNLRRWVSIARGGRVQVMQ